MGYLELRDENGNELTDADLLRFAIESLSDVCCLLFEAEDDYIIDLAYTADKLLYQLNVLVKVMAVDFKPVRHLTLVT